MRSLGNHREEGPPRQGQRGLIWPLRLRRWRRLEGTLTQKRLVRHSTFAAEAVGEVAGQAGANTVSWRGALKRVWRAPSRTG